MKSVFKLVVYVILGLIVLDWLFDDVFFVSIFSGAELIETIIVAPIVAIIMFGVFAMLFVLLAGAFGVIFALVGAAILAAIVGSLLSMWPLILFGLFIYWLFSNSKGASENQY
jgi:hypothetical protein